MTDAILTLNAGSSSIKFSLFEADAAGALTLDWRGEVEGVGSTPHFAARDPAGVKLAEESWPDPNQAFQSLIARVIDWAEATWAAKRSSPWSPRGPWRADHDLPERVLSRVLSVPRAQIATIGDMPTGIPMFRESGLGIAMGNAIAEVETQARFVTTSCNDEGFAKAVERLLLGAGPRRGPRLSTGERP